MARSTRSTKLETRTQRLELPVVKKPVFVKIGPGLSLGYRRNQTAGTWVMRVANGRGGSWTRAIGNADDFDEADDNRFLTYWAAQDKARAIGGGDTNNAGAKPITVDKALAEYEADLRTRGGDVANVARVRMHLPAGLQAKAVALLGARELKEWRDGLVGVLAPASINRTTTVLKAALNLAAQGDERIVNHRAWGTGLAAIPDAEQSRNVILAETVVRDIVAAAYARSSTFGVLVEVLATTGARISQVTRLEVQDLHAGLASPRLMMPTSRKGRGVRMIKHRPVPIPLRLATKLQELTASRDKTAPLLIGPRGGAWKKSDHPDRLFARAIKELGRDPEVITLYALRHSSIVRQILAGVPIRIVAVGHDTSVSQIEATYSRHIGDHSDALVRGAMFDLAG
jgi:integrase